MMDEVSPVELQQRLLLLPANITITFETTLLQVDGETNQVVVVVVVVSLLRLMLTVDPRTENPVATMLLHYQQQPDKIRVDVVVVCSDNCLCRLVGFPRRYCRRRYD